MTWYFDSHIHLSDPLYQPDIAHILRQMEVLQIRACCVSMDGKNSLETLNLAKSSNGAHVLPFVGIHPECAAADDLESMVRLVEDNRESISGIGEIGLDPGYADNGNLSRQVKVFETLLSLAERFDKPVSIHSRKSLEKVFDIMTSYDTSRVALHWFDGSKKSLAIATDMGFYVSYGPVTVYANDKQVLLSKTDESRILVETDGPVRFSRCFEMKSAQISFIPSVIFCAAKKLGRTFDEMASLVETNSKSFLGI